ncbi:hypothetical protein PH7735_00807 [Shimia thalassica]|uniref:Uncharacterized protein n=1 Tax=Shimia thalassica TaxID=1715693 RepID=A0A0P1I3F1_9RHOB|nr:hypothetical protein [Shimia thalassica]CUJ87716.1 hypothetical protein PH7735_00807 [Shimia thalassica]
MTMILKGTKPSGDARPYLAFMEERGIKRTTAFAVLNTDYCPPTFQIGNRRFIDEAVGLAWFAALADGQFQLTSADLKGGAA